MSAVRERGGEGRGSRRLLLAVLGVALQAFVTLAACFTCFFALWLVPRAATSLLSVALEAIDGEPHRPRRQHAAGAMFVGYVLLLAGGVALASGAVPPWVYDPALRDAASLALAIVLPAAIAAACAPFTLAPFAILDDGARVGTAIARSFELAARRGPLASARDAGLVGAAVGLGIRIAAHPADPAGWLWMPVAAGRLALAVAILGGVALAIARTYALATASASRAPSAAAQPPRATGRLGAVLGLLVPSVLAVGAAMLAAVATPAPMRAAPFPDLETARGLVVWGQGTVSIPGGHGLSVSRVAGGVAIATADGGGAGHVDGGPDFEPPRSAAGWGALLVLRERFRGRDALAIHTAARSGGGRVVHVDDEGVRLDDDLSDRISARVHHDALTALAIALLVAVAWGLRVMRALGDARALDAPAVTLAEPVATDETSRLVGRLRLGAGSTLRVRDGRARVDGDARVVSRDGEIVFALPAELRLFAPHDGSIVEDGAEVEVVGHLGAISPTGPREGAREWPAGARLLVGQRDDAAERLVARAARGGALVAALVAALLVVVAVSIVAAL